MSRLTRDGTAEPVSRDQILRHARGQGNIIFPVQLTTSRIGNLTRLIHTLLYVMTIHTYNSLYRMPLVYLFLTCVFCYSCSFLSVVFCVFVFFFCSHWSLVDVPLIFFCPADHVPDWQPRVLLGMVEARSVNVKKTTTNFSLKKIHTVH